MQHSKFIFIFIALLFLTSTIKAQQTLRPFPQHVVYSSGTIKPSHISQQRMDDSVKKFYHSWKEKYIKPAANDGGYYVLFGEKNKSCVSEGQGYGMMITALMAGYDTETKSIYDGLYKYYRSHPADRNKFLMAWQQDGNFVNVEGTSATDGDMDIAYSLLLANAQWGSAGTIDYLAAAKSLIDAIAVHEINPKTFSILLSDAVASDSRDYFDMRCSDFMPAHFKTFEKYSTDILWDKVIDNNYMLFSSLQGHYSPDAGLVPDFVQYINTTPMPAHANYLESEYDGLYNYNSCRVPWRIATDVILNGDVRAKLFVKKINDWVIGATNNDPDNISAGYDLEGDGLKDRNYEAPSFICPFAVAAMTDKKYQPWLNKLWDHIEGFKIKDFDYYDNTIKMISLIILSGNYWVP